MLRLPPGYPGSRRTSPRSAHLTADYDDPQSTRPFEIGRSIRPSAPTNSAFSDGPSWPQRSGLRTKRASILSVDPRTTRDSRLDPTSNTTARSRPQEYSGGGVIGGGSGADGSLGRGRKRLDSWAGHTYTGDRNVFPPQARDRICWCAALPSCSPPRVSSTPTEHSQLL